jgi:hypothetical protein
MKANELRVGNYLTNYKGEICQIKYFHSGEAYSDGKKDNHGTSVYSIDRSNPIPITEEWLLKLGFHEADRTGKYVDFSIGKHLYLRLPICKHLEKDYWYALRGDVKIQYVHQLQNLYHALTGEEL